MSDLIDRWAAIDAVKNYWKAEVDAIPKDADFSTVTGTCDVIMKHSAEICRVLDHLPTAQPKTGRWEAVKRSDGVSIDFRCSACHRFRFHNGELRRYKYCPECGCRMEEGD